jgi:hypothetical protein
VSENEVLNRMHLRQEVTGWVKLHNKELHNIDSSPNIIRVITSRRMRWTAYVACIGKTRKCIYNFSNLKGKDPNPSQLSDG